MSGRGLLQLYRIIPTLQAPSDHMRKAMSRSRASLPALALLGLILNSTPAAAETAAPAAPPVHVSIEDFRYLDTSQEPVDQTSVHQARMQTLMAGLRKDIAADPRFLLAHSFTQSCTDEAQAGPDPSAGAKIRIVGGVHKVSTLVQWARVRLVDAGTNKVLHYRLYTFRGDSQDAWDHAEAFLSEDIRSSLATLPIMPAAAKKPIAIAVFDFELEDASAAGANATEAEDAAKIDDVTSGVRELFEQSGRYRLVDVSKADADAVRKHTLSGCGGCDAAIARQLGADQSAVGVVRRVSRTEYVIRVQIRDAQTGAVISNVNSGLRMGADYSWRRGAVRLISDHMLAP